MKRFPMILAALTLLAGFPVVTAAAANGPGVGQYQQAELANLNAARWNPSAWGDAHGVDLDGLSPRPPLAVNPDLTGSANFKANEMAEQKPPVQPYFAHQSPVTGMWPNQLAIAWGYDLSPALGVEVNTIEVIYAGGIVPILALLSGGDTPHRRILLEWDDREEIGVGMSNADYYWAIHTGYRDGAGVFLTGTVYGDLNGNGIMDAGEGLPGITITAGNRSTTSNDGGGYSLQVPGGTHPITASGPGYHGTSSAHIRIAGYNVSADFLSGVRRPVIRDYQLCKGREPTILGTSGDDIIYGTNGPDVIHGLSGNDTIYGLRGNDIICGGRGNDILKGGRGNDRLIGSGGNDRLNGGSATDICRTGETLRNCEI